MDRRAHCSNETRPGGELHPERKAKNADKRLKAPNSNRRRKGELFQPAEELEDGAADRLAASLADGGLIKGRPGPRREKPPGRVDRLTDAGGGNVFVRLRVHAADLDPNPGHPR